ncbi:MAG: hypothetical protein LC132_08470 [Burkholderiales bacterium]|nr:hypothetical protein [Burkholderiales bacterium]
MAYGAQAVSEAARCGAVQTLMVADTLLRDPVATGIIRQAEEMRSEVVIFSSRFNQRASGLGNRSPRSHS